MTRTYPHTRLRRLRMSEGLRRLCSNVSLRPEQLVYPVFFHDGPTEAIEAMPGQKRFGMDDLLRVAERSLEQGLGGLALFPVIHGRKEADGRQALDPNGLMQRALRQLRARFPDLVTIADVALDPYTSHGQDGVLGPDGLVLNDETVAVLAAMALSFSEAGASILGLSDMMDGRVGTIRQKLEENRWNNIVIMSYTAKYASALYGPFRSAVGSDSALGAGDKKNYQMNPANWEEAEHEAAMDVQEGADILLVKPAGYYLDIVWRLKEQFRVPVWAYQVSGEYAMLKHYQSPAAILESVISCRRAGADVVITYFAEELAGCVT